MLAAIVHVQLKKLLSAVRLEQDWPVGRCLLLALCNFFLLSVTVRDESFKIHRFSVLGTFIVGCFRSSSNIHSRDDLTPCDDEFIPISDQSHDSCRL